MTIATTEPTSVSVYRLSPSTSVIDITGDLTGGSDDLVQNAYAEAALDGVHIIVLNFAALEYMNSSGIGLLVTLLIRANRQHRELVAVGLSDHYRNIFELTRLNEAIRVFDSVADIPR